MASGSCQGCEEEDEETLKKLIVRLNNLQEGKQIETLVQILEDMQVFTYADHAAKLFQGKNVHVPLLIVLDSYVRVACVQQVGWSLLCKLIEICPDIMQSLTGPQDIGCDWEVLGIHQLIIKMLTVHNASMNLSMVGLKALDLLLTSGKITLLILDEDSDIFLLIFDAMKKFSANDEVQKLGCKALHVLFERVSEEQLTEFVENKDYMILLTALKNFKDEEEIVLYVLRCLHSLASPCNNVEVLMSGNVRCYNIVVEAMKAFPVHEKIQEVSCCLLHRLTLGNFFNILVLNEVHEFVVEAVQRYSKNATLQIAGLSCLALLTETIFLNQDLEVKNENEENEDDEEEDKLFWLEACYKALTWHRKNKHVQEAACWALNNLLMYQNSLHEKIGDEDGQFPAHREVMLSMLMHSSSKEVFQASANALCTLLEQNVNFRKILLSKGIYLNVLELMKRHLHSPEVAESGCKMLNHLFEGSNVSLDVMAAVAPKIITVMKSHGASLSVQLEALRAILHFLLPGMPEEVTEDTEYKHKLKIVTNQCFRNDIHKLVLGSLNRFIGNPGIQKCGLKVISSIARFPDALEVLSLEGAIESVLQTLKMYPDDQEIQRLGLSLIGCLITKKNLILGIENPLAKILVSSLQRFKDITELQTKFLSLCCKCFAKLAMDDELKGVMLERACDQNNSIMVECLLLLGADANRAKEGTSLICQVCEKASSPKLVELLLNSGSHEQDVRKALAISIGKGDSQIISLLLKRLALDLANNSICLGGFCIGKIEPSWLGPLFPDKTCNSRKEINIGSTLARMVLRYQTKSSVAEGAASGSNGDFSEQVLDKFDQWTFIPESYVDSVFGQSDDLDSEGSEGSFLVKKKSSSISVGEFYRDPALQRCSPNLQSHSRSSKLPSHMRHSDSTSSLASEREYITSLDLSANELRDIDALSQKCCISGHLEHLARLELHQNALTGFPQRLCEVLKCLTHLDLHSNKFTAFPSYLLKMNCIANLDVSRNDIGPSIVLDPAVKCPTLKQFNLSYNQLSSVPENLGDVAEKLEQLTLEGNKISGMCSPLSLKELKILNLSKNNISSLSEDFLEACPKVESFSARMNSLAAMPFLPSSMTNIKLSQNRFTCVPEAILNLPHLRSLDMSSNEIKYLPSPAHWKSLNLRELLFSHNQISILDLSEKAHAWSRVEKLHLSHNKLKEIPPEIGCLENLTSLDVSYNLELRSFPNEMGKLSKIWDLPLDELRLNFDFKHIGCKAKDIIRFLQQRLKKAVPYNRMKLMIVGNTGSGKTTLLQQLMKTKKSDAEMQSATVGIDVKDWPIQIRGKRKKDLILNVWDFAGREEFYSTHPHFMTPRSLYLAVYDLSKGQAEVDAMKPWLFNIKARASSSPVILVGTHLDVSDEKQRKACISKINKELLNKRGFPAIRDYHFVNATEESDALAKLRKTIINESLNFKIRDQPVVGQLIPDCYVELEKIILSERKNVPIEFPVIDRKRLLQLVKENQLQLDENELPHAVHFLNESGVLLHFQDPALQLSNLYFVEPKWLCKVMAQILTEKVEGGPKYPKGIISRRSVEKFLSKKKRFPKNYTQQYFKLLEKFQIALPIGEEHLLVPSSLSDHRPVIELPHCENSEIIIRLYEMPYFPMGFWSRLINRLLEISPYMLSGRERALRPNRMYWRQGIYLNWSPEAYCLVESEVLDNHPESFLKITVPSCRKGCIILGQVVDHIDSLMEEWFPGLLEIDICGEGETLLKKWALYSFNDGEEHEKILLDDLMKKAEEGDLLVNPDQPRLTLPISQIAPDLILADLPRNIMLNSEKLEFEQAPEFLLGDGSFGSVYRATYEGDEVAVKIFNKHTSLRLLRQELVVLCHHRHPSLVFLLAAGIRPRMLVMELAPKGSLDRLLQQDTASLTRTLQHRIALHVADGLRYLHSAMIIYRDLKPHNVLLFTLYPNAAIIAKIADYGIAQYCCRMGIKTSEGTPGFRAPEVARGNVIYNQQADVYSFGLLLYDILTTGGRIAEGLKFPNEFDELAIQGKLPDPVKEYGCAPWPMVEKLIKSCLKENPQERPTSAQVFDILNSAELICLMRHIPIPKSFTVECMVAANQSCKNASIWLGCGPRDRGQLSLLDLTTERLTSEEVTNSRILCLTLVHLPVEKESWIVSGTQSGELLVINSEDGKKMHTLEKMTDSVTCLHCNSISKQRFSYAAVSDSNIIAVVADRVLYIAKKNSPFVEVWDKKTEKLCELIDCAHFLKEEMVEVNKESKHNMSYSGRVKTLCLQKNSALWIGTGGGYMLLLDLSTLRLIRIIHDFCDSVRVMMTAQIGTYNEVAESSSGEASTWDKGAYKAFNGRIFSFESPCTYTFCRHCVDSGDFNIEIKRNTDSEIEKITVLIDNNDISISGDTILVNGESVQIPYNNKLIHIKKHGEYNVLNSRRGILSLMWDKNNKLSLTLHKQYPTCGLCGNFNTTPGEDINEHIAKSKIAGDCPEATSKTYQTCEDGVEYCNKIIGTYFEECGKVSALSSDYKKVCIDEYCQNRDKASTCDTYSELSRLCASDGPGTYESWRNDSDVVCEKPQCPEQHIYKECGPSNPATCSNVAPFQDSECVSGCTCPEDKIQIFKASLSYFQVETYSHVKMQVQTDPVMQLYVSMPPNQFTDTVGLCGSYNNRAEDDFMSSQNILEKSSQAFADSWEMMSCPKGNPTSCISIDAENCSGGAEYVDCSDPKAQRRVDSTCSTRNIPNFEDQNVILQDGKVTAIKTTESKECELNGNAYTVHTVGLYLILKFVSGITVIWDKNTRMTVILEPYWNGKVCGLCGNSNGDLKDDFTTRYSSVATGALEFGNSWKTSQECSDTVTQTFPCDSNPYCKAWAVRKCEIIRDSTFRECHSKVDPSTYYDACIEEACACDMEGKYLGFCTAVAMYAEACSAVGVCVAWRKPDLCRCYAKCPESAPYLDENTMKCVRLSECSCFYNDVIPAGPENKILPELIEEATTTRGGAGITGDGFRAAGTTVSSESEVTGKKTEATTSLGESETTTVGVETGSTTLSPGASSSSQKTKPGTSVTPGSPGAGSETEAMTSTKGSGTTQAGLVGETTTSTEGRGTSGSGFRTGEEEFPPLGFTINDGSS
ncbi:Leucine-rich repeat serine/threonine-protein kinase 2 [Myotis davidii]|uniref:Leucine-rich repeat serine/threonine-protein kinase 2 n=2 Tax=Myotis davidii TaxID=225400 RepID=L5LL59_MYODS|nr:Leucine-rich repeat serine/threonine-protein kinase 2 [Myotis davidii]